MITKQATPPNRHQGFALLARSSRALPSPVKALAEALESEGAYEVVQVGGDFWIRGSDPGAKTPFSPQRLAVSTNTSHSVIAITAAVARFENNRYGEFLYSKHTATTLSAIKSALRPSYLRTPTPGAWYRLVKATFLAPRGSLSEVVLDYFLPTVFRWFPQGTASFYVHDPSLESRFSLHRLMRISAAVDITEFPPDTPDSLSRWSLESSPQLFDKLMEWASVLTYPHVSGMMLGPYGLSISFTDDGIGEYKPPRVPLSLLDLKHGKSQFGQEQPHLTIARDSVSVARVALHGRYCWNMDTTQALNLADFVAERATRLIRCLCDITRYERVVDGALQVDLVLPQEQVWTIGRIIRRTLSLQTSESRWINRLAVFEVADQWSELTVKWRGGSPVEVFKKLLDPVDGAALVQRCLEQLPLPWKDRFAKTCANAYDEMLRTIKSSVWSTKKKNTAGVNIGTGSSSHVEAWPQFVANVMRDLRNTHHGYMPDEKHKKTRLRLILTRGDWPAAATYLPSLWLLAFLCDPTEFLGWPSDPTVY